MNVTVKETGPCRKVLRVEVPVDQVTAEYGRVVEQFHKQARIKGFRPGKAPRQLVERQFAKEIHEEVKDRLIPRSYHAALKEKEIEALAVLNLDDVSFAPGQAMTFSVTLDVPPEFKLPDYNGIRIDGRKPEVKDEEVDEVIRNIREQYARYDDVDGRAVIRGDLVQVDYEGVCDGKPIEDISPQTKGLGSRTDFWVMADEQAFIPEFADGLIGTKIGDKKQIFVKFGAELKIPELAGREASYFVTVKGIREKILPELDAELLKSFQVETEQALRDRIRADLVRAAESREEDRRRSEIVKHLLEKTKIEVPESLLEEETRNIIQDIVRENTARGVQREMLEEKKDEIYQAANRNASDRVRIQFILDRIAQEEKIEVSDEDFAGHLRDMAARYGMPEPALRAELERREALDNIRREYRRSRTLGLLLERATIKL